MASVAAIAARCGMNHLGVCPIPIAARFHRCERRRVSRYCVKHCPGQANVAALRSHRRSAADYSAAG
jgi:hypothetical protein